MQKVGGGGMGGITVLTQIPKISYPRSSNVRGKLICTESSIKSCAVWRSTEYLGILKSGIVLIYK